MAEWREDLDEITGAGMESVKEAKPVIPNRKQPRAENTGPNSVFQAFKRQLCSSHADAEAQNVKNSIHAYRSIL